MQQRCAPARGHSKLGRREGEAVQAGKAPPVAPPGQNAPLVVSALETVKSSGQDTTPAPRTANHSFLTALSSSFSNAHNLGTVLQRPCRPSGPWTCTKVTTDLFCPWSLQTQRPCHVPSGPWIWSACWMMWWCSPSWWVKLGRTAVASLYNSSLAQWQKHPLLHRNSWFPSPSPHSP